MVPLGLEEYLSQRIYLASIIREYLTRVGYCGVFLGGFGFFVLLFCYCKS